MKYSEAKTVLETIINVLGFDMIDAKDVFAEMADECHDFEIANYRFINSDEIDVIQQEELGSDLYMLGCFNADFIGDYIPGGKGYEIAAALQKAEAFEELGTLVVDEIEDIQAEYSRLDGYGHHFSHYDGNEYEINSALGNYHAFRIN